MFVPRDKTGYFEVGFNATGDANGDLIVEPTTLVGLSSSNGTDAWYLSVYIFGNWKQEQSATYATILAGPTVDKLRTLNTANSKVVTRVKCNPGNQCGEAKGPLPYACLSNYKISKTFMSEDLGGSVALQVKIEGNPSMDCGVQLNGASDSGLATASSRQLLTSFEGVYGYFVLRSNQAMPTFVPTAAPTFQPTRGVPNGAALAAKAPLPITFLLTMLYAGMGIMLAQLYAKAEGVHKPPVAGSAIKMGLMGSSFCSEIYLVTFMQSFPNYRVLAFAVVALRCSHFLVFFWLSYVIFMRNVAEYKQLLDKDVILVNSKVFGVVMFICMTDVTTFSFLPWRDSEVTQKALYPNFYFFITCLTTKTLSGAVTVCAQIIFNIGINSGEQLKNMSLTNQVFLAVNVLTTLTLAMLNVFDLIVKSAVLHDGSLKTAAEMPPRHPNEVELSHLGGSVLGAKDVESFRQALRASIAPTLGVSITAADVIKLQARLDRIEDEIPELCAWGSLTNRQALNASNPMHASLPVSPRLSSNPMHASLPVSPRREVSVGAGAGGKRISVLNAVGQAQVSPLAFTQVATSMLSRRASTNISTTTTANSSFRLQLDSPYASELSLTGDTQDLVAGDANLVKSNISKMYDKLVEQREVVVEKAEKLTLIRRLSEKGKSDSKK